MLALYTYCLIVVVLTARRQPTDHFLATTIPVSVLQSTALTRPTSYERTHVSYDSLLSAAKSEVARLLPKATDSHLLPSINGYRALHFAASAFRASFRTGGTRA